MPALFLDALDLDLDATWRTEAHCLHLTALFFPERGGDATEAKAVCRGCPVREPCLEFALITNQTEGVWGGATDRELRRLRRSRAAERAA